LVVEEMKQVITTARNCKLHLMYHRFRKEIRFGWKCEIYSYFNTGVIEGRTDQRNAQINFSLINLLLFKLLRHVSAT